MTKTDADYAAWELKVDSIIQKDTGGRASASTIDTNYRESYRAGQSPAQAAREVLIESGLDF